MCGPNSGRSTPQTSGRSHVQPLVIGPSGRQRPEKTPPRQRRRQRHPPREPRPQQESAPVSGAPPPGPNSGVTRVDRRARDMLGRARLRHRAEKDRMRGPPGTLASPMSCSAPLPAGVQALPCRGAGTALETSKVQGKHQRRVHPPGRAQKSAKFVHNSILG